MNKNDICINVAECTPEQRKEIVTILKGAGEHIHAEYLCELTNTKFNPAYKFLVFDEEDNDWAVFLERQKILTFDEFKAFFQGEQTEGIAAGINDLVNLCHTRSKNAGWHDNPREDGTMIALIHSEVSEAMEGFRKDLMDDHLPSRKMAEVELADAVIRICDLAGAKGFDLEGAIREKLDYNSRRADHKRENRMKEGGKKF